MGFGELINSFHVDTPFKKNLKAIIKNFLDQQPLEGMKLLLLLKTLTFAKAHQFFVLSALPDMCEIFHNLKNCCSPPNKALSVFK